jgi:hypothetical protein
LINTPYIQSTKQTWLESTLNKKINVEKVGKK